jgi:hypothetical protein
VLPLLAVELLGKLGKTDSSDELASILPTVISLTFDQQTGMPYRVYSAKLTELQVFPSSQQETHPFYANQLFNSQYSSIFQQMVKKI